MVTERYLGERQGLELFLEDLLPVAARLLGEGHLLAHAIRRALRDGGGGLDRLRHARTLYNNLPREQRQELSRALARRRDAAVVPPLPHRRRRRRGRSCSSATGAGHRRASSRSSWRRARASGRGTTRG